MRTSVSDKTYVAEDEGAETGSETGEEPVTPPRQKQAFQVEASPLQNGHGRPLEAEAASTMSQRSLQSSPQADTEPLFVGMHTASASLTADRGVLNRSISVCIHTAISKFDFPVKEKRS